MPIQNALLEKARQCDDYKQALIKTGENIIVQSYAGDDFFGAGVPFKVLNLLCWDLNFEQMRPISFKYCKDWCDGMEKNKATLKVGVSHIDINTFMWKQFAVSDDFSTNWWSS